MYEQALSRRKGNNENNDYDNDNRKRTAQQSRRATRRATNMEISSNDVFAEKHPRTANKSATRGTGQDAKRA